MDANLKHSIRPSKHTPVCFGKRSQQSGGDYLCASVPGLLLWYQNDLQQSRTEFENAPYYRQTKRALYGVLAPLGLTLASQEPIESADSIWHEGENWCRIARINAKLA